MKKCILLLFIFSSILIFGQNDTLKKFNNNTIIEIDKKSYNLFINKNYDELIIYANKNILKSIDFYNLRYRLAIAYFEKKQFEKAIPHFEYIYYYNYLDDVIQEYLYYSYIYANKINWANIFYPKLNINVKKKIEKLKNENIDLKNSLSISSGIILFSNSLDSLASNLSYKKPLPPGFAFLAQNLIFLELAYTRYFNSNFNLSLGASTYLGQTDYINSYIPYFINLNIPNILNLYKISLYNKNFQGNVLFSFNTNNFWNFILGFGLYNNSYNSFTLNKNNTFTQKNIIANYNSINLAIGKKFKNTAIEFSYTYSNLDSISQNIFKPKISYNIEKNGKVYGATSLAYLLNDTITQIILTQKLGLKIYKKIYFENQTIIGNQKNYISDYGFTGLNTLDPILWGSTFTLNFNTNFKTNLFFTYGIQQRKGSYYETNKITNYNFLSHIFNLSIVCLF